MTSNGRNVTLAEIGLIYFIGAHQKNLNEDRSISLGAKCRQPFDGFSVILNFMTLKEPE